jgi:hypothetical protein
MFAHALRFAGVVALLAVLNDCRSAQAGFVNFSNLGTFDTTSLNVGGVTVTGSPRPIGLIQDWGLGIRGGSNDQRVDFGEWIRFTFNDGPAVGIIYHHRATGGFGTAYAIFEAFGASGNSLGTRNVDMFSFISNPNVSNLYGGAAIKSFQINPTNNNLENRSTAIAVGGLTYEPETQATPVPSGLVLALAGIGCLAAGRSIRRRVTSASE